MSDELDVLFDHRLRNALHGTSLPPAPASLRSTLEDLPRTAGGQTARSLPRRTAWAALAAGLATVAVLGWAAMSGQNGVGPAGPTPSPSPSVSTSPSPTPSPSSETFDVLSPAQILERRADGTLGSERIGVWGYFSEIPLDPCASPDQPPFECGNVQHGIAENEALIGAMSEEGLWTPNPAAGAVLRVQWPPDKPLEDPEAVGLFGVVRPDPPAPLKPSLVIIQGHFFEARNLECPAIAGPLPCVDRFDVDDVLSFDDPYESSGASPDASATPFPFESPPPPPTWMANCSQPRSPDGAEPDDPTEIRYTREGWIPKSELPFDFVGSELLPDVVYYAEVAGDIPLGAWQEPFTGTADDYRWWGTSVCVATEANILYTWVPGSTYKLYRDGRRVDGGDPFDPLPSATPAP